MGARIGGAFLLIGMLAGSAIAFAGLGMATAACRSGDAPALFTGAGYTSNSNSSSSARGELSSQDILECGMQYGLLWWTMVFEAITVLLVAVLVFSSSGYRLRGGAHTFLAIVSALLCNMAYNTLPAAVLTRNEGGDGPLALQLMSAGCVSCLVCNFSIMLNSPESYSNAVLPQQS